MIHLVQIVVCFGKMNLCGGDEVCYSMYLKNPFKYSVNYQGGPCTVAPEESKRRGNGWRCEERENGGLWVKHSEATVYSEMSFRLFSLVKTFSDFEECRYVAPHRS